MSRLKTDFPHISPEFQLGADAGLHYRIIYLTSISRSPAVRLVGAKKVEPVKKHSTLWVLAQGIQTILDETDLKRVIND